MTKGKIIGYIGIVLIIIIIAFLGTKYYLYTTKKGGGDEGLTTEITKYSNLVCNKMMDSDNYSKNNIITMAFDKDNLVWLRDLSVYYYFNNDDYMTAKNELNTTSDVYKSSYQDDNFIITTTYEGEINDLQNSDWSIDVGTYTYDNLIKYYQEKEYICELNN